MNRLLRPPLQYLHFLVLLQSCEVMPSCFSLCNVLVLITTNNCKHSVMEAKTKTFWLPGEQDCSLSPSHYKSCGSFNSWTVMLSIFPNWLQRSSGRTALLLQTAMVPNSTRYVIQYQFGALKEFVIHQNKCCIGWFFTSSGIWVNAAEGLSSSGNAAHTPIA